MNDLSMELYGLEHGKETLWKSFPKNPLDGDGQLVNVYVTSLPAKFCKVEALADTDSVGNHVEPFTLETGSGYEMEELALKIAKAASKGMIGISTMKGGSLS